MINYSKVSFYILKFLSQRSFSGHHSTLSFKIFIILVAGGRVVVNFSFFPLNCLRTTDPCQTRRLEWRWRGNGRRIHSSLAHETVLVLWYYLLPSSFNGEGGRECKRSKEGVTCVQKRRLEREIKTEKIRQKQQSFWPTMIKYVFMVLILLKHRHVRT